MTKYEVKYCLLSDARQTLKLDKTFENKREAIDASLTLEEDPDVYTSWIEEVINDE